MINRSFKNQNIHDRVIQVAAANLDKTNHDVFTNPNSEKNVWIGNNYPDIIMSKKGTSTVEFIIEVETADSVNITEATNQWKKYATEIRASFYILVPLSHRLIAINLCKQVGISARFGTYEIDFLGNIININYE